MTTANNADLFMHPASQSCVIEEVADEEPQAAASQPEQQQQKPRPSAEAAAASTETAYGTSSQPPPAEIPAESQPAGETLSSGNEPVDEQLQQVISECERLKQEGNALFAQQDWHGALELYCQALEVAPEQAQERSVYCCNAAACYLKLQSWQAAVEQCNEALRVNSSYIKALVRRSTALRELDDPEHALADAKRVLELDPHNPWAASAVSSLSPLVAARQEAMKEEMIGKLKDLGNSVLGKFGLSLANFKTEQDPDTGGYSIKFSQ